MADKNMWEIEEALTEQGVGVICGVDEAGRGPLAGPVYAAAVILPDHLEIPGLDDSKKLTDKRRRELMPIIKEQAIAYGIGVATEQEIDEINILQATFWLWNVPLLSWRGRQILPSLTATGKRISVFR